MNDLASNDQPIRVGIADDDILARTSLTTIIDSFQDMNVCWAVESGDAAINNLRENSISIDVLLLDAQMPPEGGVKTCRELKDEFPEISCIIVTTFTPDMFLADALKSGADGFLVKDDTPFLIADAIRMVRHGGKAFSQSAANRFRALPDATSSLTRGAINPLTARETKILQLVAESLTNRQISTRLGVTPATIKNHISSIIAKLNCTDRVGIVVWGIRNGAIR